jgi:ribonuclease T1
VKSRATIRLFGLLAVLGVLAGLFAPDALSRRSHGPRPEAATALIALADLPGEAREVYARIRAGGPFRYARDGVVFGNRERMLPEKPRGYYHEYTVPTPGERSRGARRIVCGSTQTKPDDCFYTNDHYRSFRRIRP